MNTKTILYLRTDIVYQDLVAGGSVSHTLGVVRGFVEHDCRVVCGSSVMLSLLKTCDIAYLKSLTIPRCLRVLRWRMMCLLSNIFFLFQLFPLCKQYTFDYIYQRYSPLNCVGVLLSRLKKIPLIIEYNSSEVWKDAQWTYKKKRLFRYAKLMHAIELYNLRNAHTIVVVSAALKDELCERGIDCKKIIINPNGVNTDLFDPAGLEDVRTDVRKKLNLRDKDYVIGFVGTFSVWHGIECLGKMIPDVVAAYPYAYFLLIGDGPLLISLQKQLQRHDCIHNIICTGMLPPDQTRRYLAACDAFISPTQPNKDGTRFFGSPTKLFEYMSMAKPIIVSDLEQLAEVVCPAIRLDRKNSEKVIVTDEVGIVVDPEDTTGFVYAASYLLECDKKSQKKMGENARNRVIGSYTWQQHVQRIIEFVNREGDVI